MTQPIICQTRKGWINLVYARKVCLHRVYINMCKQQPACVITWSNGDTEAFFGKDAEVIAQTWKDRFSHPKT
ncbi:hypothetical protein CEN39_19390 [Fischerella thermalis CCMEE 5201]|jgi:hypothetical protein|nr:hypothetical protein CEN39_19390 [Fischerella thermalis CCMEE 5201]